MISGGQVKPRGKLLSFLFQVQEGRWFFGAFPGILDIRPDRVAGQARIKLRYTMEGPPRVHPRYVLRGHERVEVGQQLGPAPLDHHLRDLGDARLDEPQMQADVLDGLDGDLGIARRNGRERLDPFLDRPALNLLDLCPIDGPGRSQDDPGVVIIEKAVRSSGLSPRDDGPPDKHRAPHDGRGAADQE
jgi:hypothetical protein